MSGALRAGFGPNFTTTTRAPSVSAVSMSRSRLPMAGWPFVFSVVSENATSSAVIGLPSWKVMPSRKWNL